MSQEKVRVLIEVNRGVVTNVRAGDFVDWQVLDWDNLLGDGCTPEDTARELDRLPEWVKIDLQANYPEDWLKLQEHIASGK
jgi:hypothetical protein